MAGPSGAKIKVLKAAFWVTVLTMMFIGITLTADVFGYSIPIPSINFQNTQWSASNASGVMMVYRPSRTNAKSSRHVNTGTLSNKKGGASHSVNAKFTISNDTTVHNLTSNHGNKVTHIGFLKVHKAGSTTMQNMFFRFGLKHNLNIILPSKGNYLLSKSMMMKTKYSAHPDIFACHTVYSKNFFDDLLPASSARIGIIREPLDRMISGAYYYRDVWGVGYLKSVPKANFIHNIVQHPEKYDNVFFSRTRNSMGKDFGFSSSISKTGAKSYLEKLNKEFDLVMVTEQFDESLVLMRRLLRWSIADIVYISTNSHKHTPTLLTEEELTKFKSTSYQDYAIYDFFRNEFAKKLEEAGQDVVDEVKYFKEVLVKVKQYCETVAVPSNSNKNSLTLRVGKSKWDNAFVVTKSDCLWIKTPEMGFISRLRTMYKAGHPTYERN